MTKVVWAHTIRPTLRVVCHCEVDRLSFRPRRAFLGCCEIRTAALSGYRGCKMFADTDGRLHRERVTPERRAAQLVTVEGIPMLIANLTEHWRAASYVAAKWQEC